MATLEDLPRHGTYMRVIGVLRMNGNTRWMLYSPHLDQMYEVLMRNPDTPMPEPFGLYGLWWPRVYTDQPGPPYVSWMLMNADTRRVDFATLHVVYVPLQ